MSRAGIRPGKQGTALGIFGAGNVGAAVTKFVAPFVLVAYGWQTVAQVWALAIAADGRRLLVLRPRTIRSSRARRAAARSRPAPGCELEPLKNIQVWRFSLYYFFVFGAFVALALWLPHYLIDVYGVDIKTAGMIGGDVLAPGQRVPRLWRPSVRPLRRAPRDVLDLPGRGRLHLRAVLSADRLRRADGISGTDRASTSKWGSCRSSSRCSCSASSWRSARPPSTSTSRSTIPNNVGAVGGLVGMIGGLGGFVLPIAFGALIDLTGLWTSCFMLLFLLVVGRADLDARRDPADGARRRRRGAEEAARAAGNAGDPRAEQSARCPARCCTDWRPEDKAFWETNGPRDRAAQPLDLDPGAAAVLRGLAGLVGRRREAAVGRLQVHHRPSCSGSRRCRASPARRCASSIPSWCRSSAAGCGRRSRPGRC